MNWMKNMSLETLIQTSLNLVKSYQQRFWPKASKYPNSQEKQGIYSDSRHAIFNPDCLHWIHSVRWRGINVLSVFYSQSQLGRGQHLSLSQRRVFSTLLSIWAPQCHWLWCGQKHPSPHASRRTVHQSDHLVTAEKIKSEPKTPGDTWYHYNYSLDIPVQESLSQLTFCD